MKIMTVVYQNMFNPAETITAKNKLPNENQYIRMKLADKKFINKEEKEFYLRKLASETKCECHHFTNPIPMSERGAAGQSGRAVCTYRNCRHYEKDHP